MVTHGLDKSFDCWMAAGCSRKVPRIVGADLEAGSSKLCADDWLKAQEEVAPADTQRSQPFSDQQCSMFGVGHVVFRRQLATEHLQCASTTLC